MSDDLVKRLWESDEASALTNQAARRIEDLEKGFWNLHREYDKRGDRIEELEGKLAKALDGLHEAENAPEPDRHVPEFRHVMDIIGATLAELKGETDA
jgi:hypothetical protein